MRAFFMPGVNVKPEDDAGQGTDTPEETGTDEVVESSAQTPEEIEAERAENDAAFKAGFNDAHDSSPATAEPAAKTEVVDEPAGDLTPDPDTDASANAGAQSDETIAEEPVLAGLTETEIKSLLADVGELREFRESQTKQMQQAFGKFGDLQRQINQAAEARGQSLTPNEITAEALEKVGKDYPDLAEALAGDLSKVLSGTSGPAVTQEEIDGKVSTLVDARMANFEAEFAKRQLTRAHSDWEEIRDSDDLQLWLGTQTQQYREQFLSSTDSDYIADGITNFKSWRENSKASKHKSRSRLERAIAPKGAGRTPAPTAVSDDAAFSEGFRRAYGG